jgi:MFS family permease
MQTIRIVLTSAIAGLLAGVVGSFTVARAMRPDGTQSDSQPYVLVAIVLLVVVGLLFGMLIAAAQVYSSLKLADKGEALGLPAGSIRAFMALMLLVVFPVLAVFILNSVPESDRKDLATQLLTGVTTLVVAVAAFYFGSKSVETAARATSLRKRVRVLMPKDGSSLERAEDKSIKPLRIVVATDPDDATLLAMVKDGDPSGGVAADESAGDFVYTPGTPAPTAGTIVVLQFAQANDPSVADLLTLRVPD